MYNDIISIALVKGSEMSAGIMSPPGTKNGPCENECKHIDCVGTRIMASELCCYCEKEIGYETRFYREDGKNLVHAICLEERI